MTLLDEIKAKVEVFGKDPKNGLDAASVSCALSLVEKICGLGMECEVFAYGDGILNVSPMRGELSLDIEIFNGEVKSLELQRGIGNHYDCVKYISGPAVSDLDSLLDILGAEAN